MPTYKIVTKPSGQRVRQIIFGGKVIKTEPMPCRKHTKTSKHLNKSRRRIGR